ncbi:MAG: ABC transporter permease [Mangrovibacterium sp.]
MLHHFKYAFNSLKKNKTYTSVNIIGLSLGMGVAMALTLSVIGLLSIDQFHQNKETVFKLIHREDSTSTGYSDACSALLTPAVYEELPEVVDYCQFMWANDIIIGSPENHVKENGYYVDKGWFDMLSFPLAYGDPEYVLSKPVNIVISQKLSNKLFGEINPVGKNINLYSYESEKPEIFTISGVFEDVKAESSLQFEFAIPYSYFLSRHPYINSWKNIGTRAYIRVRPGVNVNELSKKITLFAKSKDSQTENKKVYGLAPLNKSNNIIYRLSGEPSFGFYIIIAMCIIGLSILIISVINYINLSVATSLKRLKEIGVRKITGAGKKELAIQFFIEAFLVVLAAGIIAVFIQVWLVNIFLPQPQPLESFFNKTLLLVFVTLISVTVLVTAWYPSIYMSRFSPLALYKGSVDGKSGISFSRKFLVAFQFVSAILLITTSIILSGQVDFIFNKSMGMDRYNIIYFTKNKQLGEHWNTFVQELNKKPGIQSVTLADQLPFAIGNSTTSISWEGKEPLNEEWYSYIKVGENFIRTMKMEITDGKDFTIGSLDKVIVNEAAANKMKMQHPVGSFIDINGVNSEIIGVVKNFNFMFMASPDQPLFIRYRPETSMIAMARLTEGEINTGLKSVKEVYSLFSPDFILDYSFLDQTFNDRYKQMKNMRKIMSIAGFLAVIIACLGLLGLTVYGTERRVKEIGIRRINGATVKDLIGLLSVQMSKSILVAAIIAYPLAFILNKKILENFAERIEISIVHFIWSFVILLGLITIFAGWQIFRAATRNPVEALRYE